MQRDAEGDDRQVVKNRSGRLIHELLAHQQRCPEDAAGKKEDLRGKQNPGQVSAQSYFRRRKAGIGPTDKRSREKHQDDGSGCQHENHQVEDGEQYPLALVFFAAFTIAIEDCNKCDGDGATNEEIVHQIGEAECGHVGVGLLARAENPGDVFATRQPDQRRNHRGGSQ